MKKTRKSAKPASAEAIAQLADRGQDVSISSGAEAAWFSRFSA